MKDENIGARCAICNLRDYAPYKCKQCRRNLCNEHYWQETHVCRIKYDPPITKKPNSTSILYYCSECKTKLFTVNHFYCENCEQLLCLKHRHPESHKCQKECKII